MWRARSLPCRTLLEEAIVRAPRWADLRQCRPEAAGALLRRRGAKPGHHAQAFAEEAALRDIAVVAMRAWPGRSAGPVGGEVQRIRRPRGLAETAYGLPQAQGLKKEGNPCQSGTGRATITLRNRSVVTGSPLHANHLQDVGVNAKEAQLKGMMLASLAGDAAAYRLLLTALSRHLRSYYTRRLARHADAEDLVQETLVAIHAHRGTYDAGQPFIAWLHAIARHKLVDYYRRARVRRTLPLEEATAVCAEELSEATEAARDVEKLLAALPAARRTLVRHVKIEGLSAAEAAERTGLSESAVRVGVHRAMQTLARMIREGRQP